MFDFVIYVDSSSQFRYKLVARNNEKLSDNYTRLHNAKHAIDLIKRHAAEAKVFYESEDGVKQEVIL